MWLFLKSMLMQWAILKLLLKSLGGLGILVPLAFLLKLIGVKLIAILGVLALPVLIVLAIIGLPFILVFVMGGVLLALVAAALSFGLMALKIIIPIAIIVWLCGVLIGPRGDKPGGKGGTTGTTGEKPA
ncbi:MAG TPA: hypothetical protein VFG84_12050 [Gemmatimonadaceae bacterium]|nr:hypothetical protein [Gemmatimonadaceae bacterium]